MDGLTLLQQAHEVGLTVTADGDRLRIRGPRHAEPIARALIQNKLAIMRMLEGHEHSPVNGVNVYDTPTDGIESGGIVDVGAVDTPASTYVDLEWNRFFEVAKPHPDGIGWTDPDELATVNMIRHLRPLTNAEIASARFVRSWNQTAFQREKRKKT